MFGLMVHQEFALIYRDENGAYNKRGERRLEKQGQETADAPFALFTQGWRWLSFTLYKQARIWELGWEEMTGTPLIGMESIWLDSLASKCLSLREPIPTMSRGQFSFSLINRARRVDNVRQRRNQPHGSFSRCLWRRSWGKRRNRAQRVVLRAVSYTRMLIAGPGHACGLSCPFWIWLATALGRLCASVCLC